MADRLPGIEVQRAEAAVDGRVVVLDAGGDAEETRLEVADEEDEVVAFERLAGDLGEGAHERDGQRGGAAEAGAARRVGAGGDPDAGEVEVLERRGSMQRGLRIGGQLLQRRVALLVLLVGEMDLDRARRRSRRLPIPRSTRWRR